jgi:hypothetical protein
MDIDQSFNGVWLSECYVRNQDLTITEKIWQRAWIESIAIRNVPYFAKRKSNYFFKDNLPYPENEVIEINNETMIVIVACLKAWGQAKDYGSDLPTLGKLARKFFDYDGRFFFIEKMRKEISNSKK